MVEENEQEKLQPEIRIPCEVYSRIVGYLRPINRWNDGKQQEFSERKVYKGVGNDKDRSNRT